MREALRMGNPLPIQDLPRPGSDRPLRARLVPAPASRLDFLVHPRLRRASPITHYCAASAIEAATKLRVSGGRETRLGLIMCLNVGCVQYSSRFFQEVLTDPATASPLVFPETVFSAPVSHVAALLKNTPRVCTLVGDGGTFLQGIALAVDWLEERDMDACVVIGAEEMNWLVADAAWHLDRSAIVSGGAGAVGLTLDPVFSLGAELTAITEPHSFASASSRLAAAQAIRMQLPPCPPGGLLCDSLNGSTRADSPETRGWTDWPGPRLSVKRVLGEGLMAAAAWQCVAACDALTTGQFETAFATIVGSKQQAIGAGFARVA
jgi:hypothetical protein